MKTILKLSFLLSCTALFSQTTIHYPLSDSGDGGAANIFLGQDSGLATTGNYNIFVGPNTGLNNTTGKYNIFFGQSSGKLNISGEFNTFLGALSGVNNKASFNTFLGFYSGVNNTTGHNNVFLGAYSGQNNTIGYKNIYLGVNSGKKSTTGSQNVFLGADSGLNSTTSGLNVFLGSSSGEQNKNGSKNVFIGMNAAKNTNNSFENVFMGFRSGFNHKQGSRNTFLGAYAGQNGTNGKDNVFIGYKAGTNEQGSNKLYIANSNTASPLIYGNFNSKTLNFNGKVGIGTSNIPSGFQLSVSGKVIAEEVRVELQSAWPDFVFEKEYNLPTLQEVEQHIQQKGHLQDIPSAKEIKTSGIFIGEINSKLLQKIEELTLYTIAQEKKLELQKENSKKEKLRYDTLEKRMMVLETFINQLN